jgi:MYXO-CTERM domain-containing protein
MNARSVASRLSGLIGVALLAAPAHAAVETFSFVSGSYMLGGTTVPINAGITGTFSGNVEGDGYIRIGDLVSFEATVHFSTGVNSVSGPIDLGDLSLFSYNTDGGPATLFVKGRHSSPDISGVACMGLPTVADPDCATGAPSPFAMFHYAWTHLPGPLTGADVIVYTAVAPTITHISTSAAPEAPTWTMLVLGFAGLGLAGARRRSHA